MIDKLPWRLKNSQFYLKVDVRPVQFEFHVHTLYGHLFSRYARVKRSLRVREGCSLKRHVNKRSRVVATVSIQAHLPTINKAAGLELPVRFISYVKSPVVPAALKGPKSLLNDAFWSIYGLKLHSMLPLASVICSIL